VKNRLFVGSLPEQANEEELRELFSQVGEVVDVSIIRDWGSGKSRGFGFVQMATDEEAAAAIERLHGWELYTKKIRVVVAEPKTGGKVESRPIVERKAPSPPRAKEVDQADPGSDGEPSAPADVAYAPEEEAEAVGAGAPVVDESPADDEAPADDKALAQPPRGASTSWVVGALLLSAVIAAVAFWAIRDRAQPAGPLDPNKVLVVPLEVYGQTERADYLGYSFAQALAVNLAPVPDLRVLPVPQASELEGSGAQARARSAVSLGAGRLVLGTLTRKADQLHATLTLVDAAENRILWGTQKEGRDSEVFTLAAELAREVTAQLGAHFPALHAYVTDLSGDAEMAALPSTAAAIGALRRGEFKPALEATTQLVAQLPESSSALALRAHALVLSWDAEPSGENLKALTDTVERLERSGRGYPYADFYRAYIALNEGRRTEAVASYSKLLERGELAPAARAWMLRYRAVARQQQGDVESALEDLELSLRLDPTNAWTLGILSGALVDAGRRDEGLTRAQQSLALVPSYWRSHLALAYALSALGRDVEAAKSYGEACTLGRSQLPCSLYALTLRKAGRAEEAVAAVEKAAALFDTTWGMYNLACFWALEGDHEKALALLSQAVELGFADRSISADPDLASLQGDPGFEALKQKVLERLRD